MAVLLVTLTLIAVTAFFWWKKSKRPGTQSFRQADAPRDKILLHQFGPAPFVPSVSPFVIKLETFLRAANVPYQNRFDRKLGPKGKIPWLQYNDDVIADSQLCLEFVNKTFQVDLNKALTSQEKAIGHVIRRTLEEWSYWILIMYRLVFEPNASLYRILGLPRLFIWYVRRVSTSRVMSQGIGVHSQGEVRDMMKQDLNAVEELLGDRKFLFGDKVSDVTEFDCAVFGQLCQLLWQTPGSGLQELIEENHPKLVAYCQRMKEAFWPDWEERLLKPANQKPLSGVQSQTAATTNTSSKGQQEMEKEKNGHFEDGDILASNLSFTNKSNTNISNNNNINAVNC